MRRSWGLTKYELEQILEKLSNPIGTKTSIYEAAAAEFHVCPRTIQRWIAKSKSKTKRQTKT